MALLPAAGGVTPNTIERIRSCLEDPDDNGASRRHIGGRMKRDRLAAIASNLDTTSKPWVGHILALLSESLDTNAINKIMTEGPGRFQKEWDKWELSDALPAWENRRGEDRIRNLVYDLLMQDLVILYKGYEDGGGLPVSRLSIKDVCKKVKDEIGLVVIKESHLRDQLKSYGVALRNLKGEAIVRRVRNISLVGSPSTLGAITPTSTDILPTFPRPGLTGRVSAGSLNAPSRLPTPIRGASLLHAAAGHSSPPNTTPATQGSGQHRLSHSANYDNQSRMNSPSNINPFQQQTLQNSKDAAGPISSAGGDLNPASPSRDGMFNEMDDESHESRLMPRSPHLMPSSQSHFDNDGSRSFTSMQAESWSMEEKLDCTEVAVIAWNPIVNVEAASYADGHFDNFNASFAPPLVGTTEFQSNDIMTKLSEKIELLTRRLDTEHTARVQLEARANEVDKWQKDYKHLWESYEELSSGYVNQETRIKTLEDLCKTLEYDRLSEQTKREKLSDDMENLQQRYYDLDGTIQMLRNAHGELQSKILSVQSIDEIQTGYLNDLQTALRKLKAGNTDLMTDLSVFQAHNDSLRIDVTKLQTTNNQLVGWVRRLNGDNIKLDGKVEALQRQKDSLENDVSKLQTENSKLSTQIVELQEAEINLDHKVDLLERESASLHQENKAPKIKTSKEFQDRLSSCTIDSGLGESPRASIISSRKRQISITDERKEKRHRSLDVIDRHASTFLVDPDIEESPIMSTSQLPIRSGSYTD